MNNVITVTLVGTGREAISPSQTREINPDKICYMRAVPGSIGSTMIVYQESPSEKTTFYVSESRATIKNLIATANAASYTYTPVTGVVALGTTQGDAVATSNDIIIVGTVGAANRGILMPYTGGSVTSKIVFIYNGGANTMKIYPQGTDTINGGAASAAITLAAGKLAVLVGVGSGAWYQGVTA